jgi:stalled ribosome rescue protein Dom34
MDSVKSWKDHGSEAAAAENRRMRDQSDLNYKAASTRYLQEVSTQVSEIRDVIAEIRDMLETLVGITKHQDLTAYGQYRIQKAHELSDLDG